METFKTYLTERFVNAIGDDKKKEEYVDQVWDILQKSYAAIGGVKGNGFKSKEDMIKNIPFWKMVVNNGKVFAVVLYKDKSGRKSVAVGTDGSDYAKKHVASIFKDDIKRSYGEKSKGALGFLLKTVPWDVLEQFILTPIEVAKISKDDEIIPIVTVPKKEWPEDAQIALDKHPNLIQYGYLREIGGHLHFKIMIGTPGKSIR